MDRAAHERIDRRRALRRLAGAGAIGWSAPLIIDSSAAAGGETMFTPKCAPGDVTASASFVQVRCNGAGTRLRITINFSGSCPCSGEAWCAQKNSPGGTVSTTSSTLVFAVNVPIFQTIAISGRVGLGCTDRDGDVQYAVYDWSMTATDSGAACSVANSISGVTLSNRTLVDSSDCPSLAAAFLPVLSNAATAPGVFREGWVDEFTRESDIAPDAEIDDDSSSSESNETEPDISEEVTVTSDGDPPTTEPPTTAEPTVDADADAADGENGT